MPAPVGAFHQHTPDVRILRRTDGVLRKPGETARQAPGQHDRRARGRLGRRRSSPGRRSTRRRLRGGPAARSPPRRSAGRRSGASKHAPPRARRARRRRRVRRARKLRRLLPGQLRKLRVDQLPELRKLRHDFRRRRRTRTKPARRRTAGRRDDRRPAQSAEQRARPEVEAESHRLPAALPHLSDFRHVATRGRRAFHHSRGRFSATSSWAAALGRTAPAPGRGRRCGLALATARGRRAGAADAAPAGKQLLSGWRLRTKRNETAGGNN